MVDHRIVPKLNPNLIVKEMMAEELKCVNPKRSRALKLRCHGEDKLIRTAESLINS